MSATRLPAITYPAQLPVSARREDIAAAIRDHQVVIVAGETGSGKTTQLPKICLEMGRGSNQRIGHTQPRRIAARAVAERIAEELNTQLGDVIGYQVRFNQVTSSRTRVTVMTDGILLAQIQRDPLLRAYDTLIIDEAHERSLNIDFLLGYLTNLLPRRPDLKVIITSATIDSERFARHFAPGGPLAQDDVDSPTAPVIVVTGRTYPVEIRYRPLAGESRGEEVDQVAGIVAACDELMREGPGDILVFLSGEREIRDTADALRGHLGDRATDHRRPGAVEILALYSRLSATEQHRVFEVHSTRRIVLATNVAETSLTVPGIHYVVDPGMARISRYSKATKVQRLPIEPISRASANQRSGRAGRLADGIAIRLYAVDDFEARDAFTEPEILRTSLAAVLLQMIALGVVHSPDDMASFPFVEPPDTRSIRDGMNLLLELGAITTGKAGRTRLTDVGRKLAELPMDPREARMIVEASHHGVAREVAIIAAALSIQDPRERPSHNRDTADAFHRRFADPHSDLLAYLNLWEYLRRQRKELSGNQFRRLCKAEYLHYLRIREWQDLVQQLRDAAKPLGITMKSGHAPLVEDATADAAQGSQGRPGSIRHVWNEEAIHRSVLAGLLSQVGMQDVADPKASEFTHLRGEARQSALKRARKRATNEYLGARGARFAINPGSALAKKPPAFVMAAELVETSRLWARDVARIDPAWAEALAGDLAKRNYSEPHWSTTKGAAMATEKVLLYGVPIVSDRKVLWGRINPEQARELFIRHALVQGEWTTHHAFWKANQRVLEEASEVEARSRTRGLIADEDTLFDFYDDRLPDHIVSARHFDRWWTTTQRQHPQLLSLDLDALVPEEAAVDPALFPQVWPQGDLALPLMYAFDPGAHTDGVTVRVPLAVLARLSPRGFDWLVPGMVEELAVATIRALPKPVRRQLVPAPDAARAIVGWLREQFPSWERAVAPDGVGFRDAFTTAVAQLRQVQIPAQAWDDVDERLSPHLRMTFQVTDDDRVVDESHDLLRLQRTLAERAELAVRRAVAGEPARPPHPLHTASEPQRPAGPMPSASIAEQARLSTWPSGLPGDALPDAVSTIVQGVTIRGYPAVVTEGPPGKQSTALRVLGEAGIRDLRHAEGIRRLLVTDVGLSPSRVTSRWSSAQSLALAAHPYGSTDAFVDALQVAAVTALTSQGHTQASMVLDAATYGSVRAVVRERLEDQVHGLVDQIIPVFSASRALDAAIRATTSMATLATVTEVRAQLTHLVGDDFLSRTPPERLKHLPRYLTAALQRLDKAQQQPDRDAALAWQVREVTEAYDRECVAYRSGAPNAARAAVLDEVRWRIEELRVSLFAQALGTDKPVSAQRILKELRG